ncbi:multicopper oxidase domain-containing protein [Actinomadura barringtoniae]|uniref:Multicopper oxidase CueO n=1 Tax=Actinomadura barringtoniae TaxID=1427535 RepID=A0A939PBR9_9ACTN|nr:multicopper oxidase domain-containing protein [Actinomadura barringtoniae]MBO2445561.1 multicopper oxidase domain-containing protein [Actinomadura barringtoniae]
MPSRREVLKLATLSGAVLVVPGTGLSRNGFAPRAARAAAAVPPPFSVPLTIPKVLEPTHRSLTTDYYEVSIREAQVEVLPGLKTTIMGYEGLFPGPTIKARAGRRAIVKHKNEMAHETVVHLHGGHTAPEYDGHPKDPIEPGETIDYKYENKQPATTLWYHDHTHMMEAEMVFRGLAGFYIIEDPAEASLGLPTGQYDVPLMLRDSRFDDNGQIVFEMDDFRYRTTLLVNGKPQPYFKVAPRKYRFRLLNGSNERYYTLSLSDGSPLVQIGSDGGLLAAPIPATSITFTPGERVDVVVDFSRYADGTQIVLNTFDHNTTTPVMRFDVTGSAVRDVSRVPTRLRPMRRLGAADVNRDIVFKLDRTTGGFVINGKSFDMDRVDETVKRGDTEIWTVSNPDTQPSVPHNIHLHGVHFQVLDRNGQPVEGHETGWKDTVAVPVGGQVRIKVRYQDYTGRYLFHCHLLDHSSMGMMAQLEVVD